MKGYLFLDIDGPLATEPGYTVHNMNPLCVEQINKVIEETDCDIILTSDWKYSFTLAEMDEIFKKNKLIKSPIFFLTSAKRETGLHLTTNRSDAIKECIRLHGFEHYAIVDDMELDAPNFIRVDPLTGTNGRIRDELIALLRTSMRVERG